MPNFPYSNFLEFIADEISNLQLETNSCLIHANNLSAGIGDIDVLCENHLETASWMYNRGYRQPFPRYDHLWVKFVPQYSKWIVFDLSSKYSMISGFVTEKQISRLIKESVETPTLPMIRILSKPHYSVYLFLKGALRTGFYKPRHITSILEGIDLIEKNKLAQYINSFYNFPKPCTFYLSQFRHITVSDLGAVQNIISDARKDFEIKESNIKYSSDFYLRLKAVLAKPKTVAIIGPDGAGKSSIIKYLSNLLFCNVKYMGPGQMQKDVQPLLKKALEFLDKGRYKFSKVTLTGKVFRFLYMFTIYLDLLIRYLGQCYRNNSDHIVFFDRFSFDVYVRNPGLLRWWLFCLLFPKPDHVVLLVGDPVKIHKRKPELTPEEISDTYETYHQLFKKLKIHYTTVNTTDCSPGESMACIIRQLSMINYKI